MYLGMSIYFHTTQRKSAVNLANYTPASGYAAHFFKAYRVLAMIFANITSLLNIDNEAII